MAGPLADIRVLDLTWALSGPYGTMILADLGAEVIKVERPPAGDIARENGPFVQDVSSYFFSINRGKRSITLNLKHPEGQRLLLELVKRVDVLTENFVPGTLERLGLSYARLREVNPRLIYAATSGFGQTGPYRERPAMDVIVQGMSGLMSITGPEGGPPVRVGTSIGDIVAGMFTAIGILAALHERERSGEGQFVDVAMLDSQLAILENALVRYFVSGEIPRPLGTRHPILTPFQAFPTKDGYIVLTLTGGGENIWALFCAAIGLEASMDDPRFQTNASRTEHHAELEALVSDALRQRTTAEWLEVFQELGIPCGPVNTIDQVVADPQVNARGMIVPVTHPRVGTIPVSGNPIKLSRTPPEINRPAPDLGQDTDQVLQELLGLRDDQIAALRACGAI
ncbi:MAG: CoA transferase [Chloroflexi bacterium]|nr:CoA transferase [Chloroflexota bacterium]